MKKKNFSKKIILNSLIGFPIGITILMISYINVYLIAGENTFINEIAQLQDFRTLLLQLIIIGCAYCLIFILFRVLSYFTENNTISNKSLIELSWLTLSFSLILVIGFMLVGLLLGSKVFKQNMPIINLITFTVFSASALLYIAIKSAIERNIVKKINKEILNRNK